MTKCSVCKKEEELKEGKCNICIKDEVQMCIDLFECKKPKNEEKKPIKIDKSKPSINKWKCISCKFENDGNKCIKCDSISPLLRRNKKSKRSKVSIRKKKSRRKNVKENKENK